MKSRTKSGSSIRRVKVTALGTRLSYSKERQGKERWKLQEGQRSVGKFELKGSISDADIKKRNSILVGEVEKI